MTGCQVLVHRQLQLVARQNVLGDKYCEDWIYLHVNPSFNPPPDAGAAVIDEACKFKLVRAPIAQCSRSSGRGVFCPHGFV